MPVIVQGGDSQSASQRDLTVFALCSLIDKRDASKSQLNIIAFSVFCSLMATWGLKNPETNPEGIVVHFTRYTRSDIKGFFNDQVHDLHED